VPVGRAAAPGVAAPTGPGFLRAAIAARASSRFRRVQVILELGVYGVALARREIRLAFEELHRQIPDVVAIAEPAILRSPFVHGIKSLQVGWSVPT
jgi:hypothetical protein